MKTVFGVLFLFLIEIISSNVVSHPLSSPYIHLRNVFLLEERVKGGRHLFAQRYCGGRRMQQLLRMPVPDKLLVHVT